MVVMLKKINYVIRQFIVIYKHYILKENYLLSWAICNKAEKEHVENRTEICVNL